MLPPDALHVFPNWEKGNDDNDNGHNKKIKNYVDWMTERTMT